MTAVALLLTGTVGSGKTTTADRIGGLLSSWGVAHAVIDLDAIRQFWPTPEDDPFGFEVELRNLAPMVASYLAVGAERLVLAGVCESRADRARYEAVLGVPLTVCRLRAPAEVLRSRLHARHVDDPGGLAWHVHRAGELDDVLSRSGVADVEVMVDAMSRDQVAEAVLHAVGWS